MMGMTAFRRLSHGFAGLAVKHGGGGRPADGGQDKSREVRPGRRAEEGRKISTLARGAFCSTACILKNMKRNQYSAHLASIGRLPAALSVFGRDDEPKMVPVIPAALREGPLVGRVGARVAHPGVGAIAGDADALEIGECLDSGADWKPVPRWRTIRVITTTRRPDDRCDRASAARRPRRKVERPRLSAAFPNRLPVCPALFAA